MYFWKVDELIENVKTNNISQKEQSKYVIAFSIIMIIATNPLLAVTKVLTVQNIVASLIMTVITVFGVYRCYTNNKKSDDNDFILRFFTIGFPVAIRYAAFLIPIAILLGMVEIMLNGSYESPQVSSESSIYQVIFFLIAQLVFFLYYSSKFNSFAKS